jgi:hypothetical protein
MPHVLKPELLDAMKDCLRDLENVQLISPEDLDIIDQKRFLRQIIGELENEESDGYDIEHSSVCPDFGATPL